MKKITAFLLSLVMIVPSIGASAKGVSRAAEVDDAIYAGDTVNIVYNGRLIKQGDVEPKNIDGRVMIPFRNVLENLGATVEYSEAEKEVTAKKDGTTINFTLMDDTIHVDNNGEKSEITMDVPMVIVDDRTLVPVRFMSNALGMEVGWSDYENTVIIVDKDELIEEFKTVAPNISKLLGMEQFVYNQEDDTLQLKIEGKGEEFNLLLDLDAKISAVMNADACGVNITFDFNLNGGGETVKIKDGAVEIVLSEGKLYLKTDALKKAAESVNSPALDEAAAEVLPDTWYSVDLNKIIDVVFLSENEKELLKNIVNLDFIEEGIKIEVEDLIAVDEAILSEATSLSFMLDVFERVDEYIVITEGEDGAYSVSVNITIEDIMNMANSMLPEYARISEEELAQVYEMVGFKVEAKTDITKTSSKSVGLIEASVDVMGESITFRLSIENDAKALEKTNDIVVPNESTDVTDLIIDEETAI